MTTNYRRWLYAMVILITVIAALYLSGWIYKVAQTGSDVVALYFFAWLFQFFFTPFVDLLARRGVPRLAAVSLVFVALGLIVTIFLVATIPALYSQGERLAKTLSDTHSYAVISNLTRGVEKFAETHFHVPPSQIEKFTHDYSFRLTNGAVVAGSQLQQLINTRLTPSNITNSATAFFNFLGALNTLFLNIVIALLLAFYMMLDGHKLVRRALAYFPPAADEVMESVHQIINRKFGGYLRGQAIIAASYGFLTYLISQGFDLRYSVIIAVLAAILMLIPFIGAFAAVIPPLIAFALVHATDASFPVLHLVLLFFLLAVMQHIVINVLAPRVMSSAMNMHPLLVMLGLLVGAKVAGLWGAIFGVPVLGVMLDVADLIYRRVMERRYGFHPAEVDDLDVDEMPPPPPLQQPTSIRAIRRKRRPGAPSPRPRLRYRRWTAAPVAPAATGAVATTHGLHRVVARLTAKVAQLTRG